MEKEKKKKDAKKNCQATAFLGWRAYVRSVVRGPDARLLGRSLGSQLRWTDPFVDCVRMRSRPIGGEKGHWAFNLHVKGAATGAAAAAAQSGHAFIMPLLGPAHQF